MRLTGFTGVRRLQETIDVVDVTRVVLQTGLDGLMHDLAARVVVVVHENIAQPGAACELLGGFGRIDRQGGQPEKGLAVGQDPRLACPLSRAKSRSLSGLKTGWPVTREPKATTIATPSLRQTSATGSCDGGFGVASSVRSRVMLAQRESRIHDA